MRIIIAAFTLFTVMVVADQGDEDMEYQAETAESKWAQLIFGIRGKV